VTASNYEVHPFVRLAPRGPTFSQAAEVAEIITCPSTTYWTRHNGER
jgi:hypothetical protein